MGLGFLLAFLPHSAPLSAVRLFHDSGLTLNLALTFFSFFFFREREKGRESECYSAFSDCATTMSPSLCNPS